MSDDVHTTVLYSTLTYDADSGEPLIPPRTFGALKTVSIKVSATEDTSSYIEMRKLGSALISTFDAPGILYSLSVVRCPLHDAMGYRVEWLTATKMLKMIKPLLLVKTLARCLRCHQEGPKCEWTPSCGLHLLDSSPAGIARHLVRHHAVTATDNHTRAICAWGDRCGKHMYPSSFGKHIAESHLRGPLYSCLHCGAEFTRSDTLARHIKAFCPALIAGAASR